MYVIVIISLLLSLFTHTAIHTMYLKKALKKSSVLYPTMLVTQESIINTLCNKYSPKKFPIFPYSNILRNFSTLRDNFNNSNNSNNPKYNHALDFFEYYSPSEYLSLSYLSIQEYSTDIEKIYIYNSSSNSPDNSFIENNLEEEDIQEYFNSLSYPLKRTLINAMKNIPHCSIKKSGGYTLIKDLIQQLPPEIHNHCYAMIKHLALVSPLITAKKIDTKHKYHLEGFSPLSNNIDSQAHRISRLSTAIIFQRGIHAPELYLALLGWGYYKVKYI